MRPCGGSIVVHAPSRGSPPAHRVAAALGVGLLLAVGCSDREDEVHARGTAGAAGEGGAGFGEAQWGELRRAAADAGVRIGAAVDENALRDDPSYATVLAREFDAVTPENATKWGPLAPASTRYDWEDADAIVDFAAAHGQRVKGHALVWHQQLPSWVKSTMSAEELGAALKRHIEVTLERYRGRVYAWDVVNEAVDPSTESGYTESLLYRILGPGYIADAFRWARAADPDVRLYYNDFGLERQGRKADLVYALLRDLLDEGVPIDGIGLQSHLSMHRYPSESHLRANIRRFADLGLAVNVSELDVRTLRVPGDRERRWEAQRVPFQQVVSVCATEPGCDAVTLWGFTDRYSWINVDAEEPDDPLVFDRDYAEKPAYRGVLAGLAGEGPSYGENVVSDGDFAAGGEEWSAKGGVLAVGPALEREGFAACVGERSDPGDGLRQDLRDSLRDGGQFSFSARVRVRGAANGSVKFAVAPGIEPAAAEVESLGSVEAVEGEWVELAGDFGLGSTDTPVAIELTIYGPPAGVDLCVADVELRQVTAP